MKKAFTLIEILTGVAIFLLVISSATGVFISAFRAQKRILSNIEIIDAVSFVLDYMSRAIIMAKKDDVEIKGDTTSCLPELEKNYRTENSNQKITFRTYKLNVCQSFFLEPSTGRIKEEKGGVQNYLTPQNLQITNLKFIVNGDEPGDNLQPRVTIFLEIQKRNQPETKVSLQTTVSQRDLDF